MATKIQLTPAELKAQAAEMRALNEEYTSLFSSFSSELKSVNGNWSTNLANNFVGKISVAQNSFKMISIELANGAKVADNCANTFTTVDAELAKVYPSSSGGGSAGTVVLDKTMSDAERLDAFYKEIDKYLERVPECYRNVIKDLLLDELKYGEVSYTDILDLVRDISSANIDNETIANIIGIYEDLSGTKSSFVTALKTTVEIIPTYLDKARANDDLTDKYIDEGNLAGALFTSFIGNGTVILQGSVDGLCKIIDNTLHLSTISDVIECVSGGRIDIGSALGKAGQGISDAVDYITDFDNLYDLGGKIADGVGDMADAAGDFAVGLCKGAKNFFKKLF